MSKLPQSIIIKCKLSLCVLLLFLAQTITSQSEYIYNITNYSSDNGLAGRLTNFTHKDSRGLMWIGTQHGLHRFDGREFKVFDEEFGLPFDHVMEIYEDKEGWLWLYRSCKSKPKDYCFKDLAFFHSVTNEVKTFEERFGIEQPFLSTEIEFITTSPSLEKILVKTTKNTFVFDDEIRTLSPRILSDSLKLFSILDDGRIGAIQEQEDYLVYKFLSEDGAKTILDSIINEVDYSIFPFTLFGNGTIWIGNEESYFKINEDGKLRTYEPSVILPFEEVANAGCRQVYFDPSNQTFWAASRNGLKIISAEKKRFFGFSESIANWLLLELKPLDDQNLFYGEGTYNFIEKKNYWGKNNGAIPEVLIDLDIEDFAAAKEIWPFRGNTFIEHNGQMRFIEVVEIFNGAFINISGIHETEKEMWLGTGNGLFSFDRTSLEVEPFQAFNEFTNFDGAFIHYMHPIDSLNFWLATNRGLFKWSLIEGILEEYSQNQEGKYYIPSDNIYHFAEDNGAFWLATDNGIVYLSPNDLDLTTNTPHLKHITKKEGLLDNNCVSAHTDEFGFLWIATGQGLVQLDLETHNFKIYTKKDGLAVDYFMEYSDYQAPSGELIFGGLDGLVSFHPKDFKDEDLSLPGVPLIIVEYEHYNQTTQEFELSTDQLLREGAITLSPDYRIFSLKVALSDSRDAGDQLYSYRIVGFQDEWQESNSNMVRMSGLPYGDHLLEIKGRLADGRESSQVLKIPIKVLRPFYLQWWFILLSISLVAFAAYSYYQRRVRKLLEQQKLLEATVEERTEQIRADKSVIEQQAEELRSLDEMKTRFFANISHELRTPLTLILAPVDSTLKRNSLEEEVRRNLLLVKRNGERLQRLVNEILDLAKLDANKLELKTDPVLLYLYLKTIVNQFDSVAFSREVKFLFNYELSKQTQIEIDKDKFEIVLYNLLSNAFKFTPIGGIVTLLVQDEGSFLKFVVSDTGRGIADYDLANIFNRFYQTKKPNAAAEGGTGIGLALTKEIVDLMKGRIEVESELDRGTSFSVYIPKKEIISQIDTETAVRLLEEEEKEPNLLIIPAVNSGNGETKATILLVEDNDHLRDFITGLLSKEYKVIQADNGQTALDKLEDFQQKETLPDIIITDIMMPIMDGYQLIEKLKASKFYTQIPVLVLTARASLKDKIKALRIGIDDYLTKPFVEEELRARVNNILQNAANRQVVYAQGGESISDVRTATTTKVKKNNISVEYEEWLEELESIIFKNIDTPDYTIEKLADDMAISKRQLARRIKEGIGTSPAEYLKTVRFAKALDLLENRTYSTVKAIALSVGFKDSANFSKQFKKRYGKAPLEYLN